MFIITFIIKIPLNITYIKRKKKINSILDMSWSLELLQEKKKEKKSQGVHLSQI